MNKENNEQSKVWERGEGDSWFLRNKDKLGPKQDVICLLLELYNIEPKRVVEVGSSNGWRLAAIHEKYGSEVIGVEPSKKAVASGKNRWPFIKFINAMGESLNFKSKVDLAIVSFVFHWVDRKNLLEFVTRIDRMLEPGGFLLLGDFGPENFVKRKYHHLPRSNTFTYKQHYQDIFISTGSYKEIARLSFNHDSGEISSDLDNNNAAMVSLLKKIEIYQED